MKYLGWMALVLALGTSGARAENEREMSAEDAKAYLEVFDKIVDTVVAHREDCPKMARSLGEVIDGNARAIARVRAAKLAGKKLPASEQQHLVDGLRRMTASLDKCGNDEKVGAAFAKLDLGGRQ